MRSKENVHDFFQNIKSGPELITHQTNPELYIILSKHMSNQEKMMPRKSHMNEALASSHIHIFIYVCHFKADGYWVIGCL